MRRIPVRRPEDLGLALSEARRAAGLTQARLSEDTGVERTYLAKLEAGVSTLLLVRLLRLLRRVDARLVVEVPTDTDRAGERSAAGSDASSGVAT